MASEHLHTDQYHIEKSIDARTGEIMIRSYCLSCGKLMWETRLQNSSITQ